MRSPDGGLLAGLLTGALLGLAAAMATSTPRAGRKTNDSGDLVSRGRTLIANATAGLDDSALAPLSSSPAV